MDVFREGLAKARAARIQVLARMREALASPRPEISPYAPRIITLFINPEKVADVIGPAGKIIKRIISTTKAKIDIEEGGKIIIASTDMQAAERAREMIREITLEAEVGKVYNGKVVRIEEYGAFLEICRTSSACFNSESPPPRQASGCPQDGRRDVVISIAMITVGPAANEPALGPLSESGTGAHPWPYHLDDRRPDKRRY
jgi:hypothetical protein